jgi:hypothetical protein
LVLFFDMKRLGLLFCDLGYDVVASHVAGATFGFDIREGEMVRGEWLMADERWGEKVQSGHR